MTTMNRITGTNSGIDVDTVVKQSLSKEQNKIDKAYQQQMIYTYQQEQLNEIVKSGQDFYGKYLDLLSSNSLLRTTAYETVKFTSTDANGNKTTAVTAKGYAGADVSNYSVSVSQIAKKAATTLNEKSLKSIVDRGNGVIAVSMKNNEGKDIIAYVDAVFTDGEINLKSTADALNIELKKQGLNVSAKYSEFSKGIVLESGESGEEAGFGFSTAAGHSISENIGNNSETFKNLFDYKYYKGQNAKGTITKGSGKDALVYQIDSKSNIIPDLDGVQFTFNSATTGSVAQGVSDDVHSSYTDWNEVDEGTTVTLEGKDGKTTVIKKDYMSTKQTYDDGIKLKSLTKKASFGSEFFGQNQDLSKPLSINENGMSIEAYRDKSGIGHATVVFNGKTVKFTRGEITRSNGMITGTKDGITVTLKKDGTLEVKDQSVTGDLVPLEASDNGAEVSSVNGKTVIKKDNEETTIETSSDGNTTTKTTVKTYADGVKVQTVTKVVKSIDPETQKEVQKETSKTEILEGVVTDIKKDYSKEPDLKITIDKEGNGDNDFVSKKTTIVRTIDSDGNKIENRVTVTGKNDGTSQNITTQYKIKEDGTLDSQNPKTEAYNVEKVTLTGETDVTSLKDTIVKFVEEYNKIISSINEKLWEKRDKDYMPLTDDQKKEMSDSQIEAWEKKAKTGLLRSDSDLRRIQNSMRDAMSAMMSGTGLTLEDIGIKKVNNYTTKNGMLEIDESKLTAALENKSAEVKDLFTRQSSGDDEGGVLVRLQSVMKSEFKSSDSSLSQRIGFSGTSTENDNTLSNYITKQKKLITELKKKYSTKETALYNKYSNLEVQLEKLNSQYNSLTSLLGQ